MSDEDSVASLITLMEKHWKIMEPEKPSLVISVVGGAKNFKLDGRMRDTFSTGLIKVWYIYYMCLAWWIINFFVSSFLWEILPL